MMPRFRFVAVVASAALVLSGTSAVAEPGAVQPPVVVSMGDSFISGEAGRWRGNGNTMSPGSRFGTDLAAVDCNRDESWCWHDPQRIYGDSYDNGCNRSVGAEITGLEKVWVDGESFGIAPENRLNIACSGATASAIYQQSFKGEPRQVDQLAEIAQRADVTLVVLSIGGNDLEFSDIITNCVEAFTTNWTPCNETLGPTLPARIDAMEAEVRRAVGSILDTMSAAGYERTDYRFVLQSYPSPIPRGADNRYPESGWSRWSSGGCPFYDADSDWAHDTIVPSIADAHSRVAAQERVDFLDLRDALDGHEVCARGAEQADSTNNLRNPLPRERSEWVRWIGAPTIGQGQTQEFMHPNSYGQEVLGECLNSIASTDAHELRCADSGQLP